MLVVENDNAKKIIEYLIPEEILKLNPVIAGGFIVAIYYSIIRYQNSIFDMDLNNIIKENKFTAKEMLKPFSDIDFWFLSDNPIHQSDHPFNLILRDEDILKQNISDFQILIGNDCNFSPNKTSVWANSFTYYKENNINSRLLFQFIKKKYSTIDELFNNFDIINCCASYYDGKFYFHDDFFNTCNNYLIKSNNFYKNYGFLNKLWTANRAFKYYNRFKLDFSEEIFEFVLEQIITSEDILKKVGKDIDEKRKQDLLKQNSSKSRSILDFQIKKDMVDLSQYLNNDLDPYDRKEIDFQIIREQTYTLFSNFKLLTEMKHFNKNVCFYFMDSLNPEISTTVRKYLEKTK